MDDQYMPSDAEWTDLFSAFPPVSTEAWMRQVREDLDGAPEDRLTWHTLDGLTLRPFYRREDVDRPGSADGSTVAVAPSEMPLGWRIRQDVAHTDVQAANGMALNALKYGAEEIGFLVDLNGHSRGVRMRSPEDVDVLLQGIDLSATAVHLRSGSSAALLPALLLNAAERTGVDLASLRGSVEIDPIGALARTGRSALDQEFEWIRQLHDALEPVTAATRILAVDARPYHEAGASPVQEIALTLATLNEYFSRLTDGGLSAGRISHRSKLIAPVGISLFQEIAKLRALRVLAHRVAAAYGDADELPITVETSRWALTRYDPHSNLLRGTTGAIAAVLGGADVLNVLPFNGPVLRGGDAFGYRLARNTQLILRHESYLDRVADPAGGAYYLEMLTDELGRRAWTLFQDIEARGGLVACLSSGYVQEQVQGVREQREQEIASGERVIVGTNKYVNPDEELLAAVHAPDGPNEGGYLSPSLDFDMLRSELASGTPFQDLLDAAPSGSTIAIQPLPVGRAAESVERMRVESHGGTPVAPDRRRHD